jgi:large subunit ribosomal protein L28
MFEHMAKVCAITQKGSITTGGYSNATRATKFNPTGTKRKYPNLQKKRIFIPELNKTVTITISTNALKTIQKNGAFKTLKKAGIIEIKHPARKGKIDKTGPERVRFCFCHLSRIIRQGF